MGYRLPTASEFKAQFPRDFPWAVPAWGAAGTITLTAGAVTAVALTAGGYGYKEAPTVFVRDKTVGGSGATITATVDKGKVTAFAVGAGGSGYLGPWLDIQGGAGSEDDLTRVLDSDIEGAQQDASFNINEALFEGQSDWGRAFNYLTAHMLVEKMLMAGEGLASQYNWLTKSKSVGDVSESFDIPDRIKDDPMLAAYSKTRYGMAYLQIISPLIIGNMGTFFRKAPP